MRDKTKALELANYVEIGNGSVLNPDVYVAAIKMAKWKDEEFKKYLLQKKDGLKRRSDSIGRNHEVCIELIDEIIEYLDL